jgi:hypothetical protein
MTGTVHIGPARVSQLPAPILGAPQSIAFQGTSVATETFSSTARQYVSPFYVDILYAGLGPIAIGVQVEGYGNAPPLALGQRLLARLYDRAKARVRRPTSKSVLIIK